MRGSVSFAAIGCLIITCSGCWSSSPFDHVKVSGSVSYEDGTPIPADSIRVVFVPQADALDEKTHPRPGVAEVNVNDGSFSVVTSHKYDDGLVPGRHKVTVISLDAQQTPTSAVPPAYHSEATTPLEVDTSVLPFHLTVEKPPR